MVDRNDLRKAFSARLHEALDDAGVRARGRGVDIHRRLKNAGVAKTTQAISKWLNGEAIAEADSMAALCAWLNVRGEWLQYGVLPKNQAGKQSLSSPKAGEPGNHATLINDNEGKVPLLSWAQAAARCIEGVFAGLSGVESLISCPVHISNQGYALKVKGDSMASASGGRSYPNGCIIFVDPEVHPKIGDRVVGRLKGSNDLTFKILVEDAGKRFLRPINPQYPMLDFSGEDAHLCGKVVGAFLPE